MKEKEIPETAFGRQASWLGGAPALVVGGVSFLLALYGTWVMPRGLSDRYARELATTGVAYEALEARDPALRRTAGELNVIYGRLIALEGGRPERYWEWAEFGEKHAANLRVAIEDEAAGWGDETREQLKIEVATYEEKSRKTFQQLAAGDSDFASRAFLHVAKEQYQRLVEGISVVNAGELAQELEVRLRTGIEASKEELDEARLIMVQAAIEAAWQHDAEEDAKSTRSVDAGENERDKTPLNPPRSWIRCNLAKLREAHALFVTHATEADAGELQWIACGSLLSAFLADVEFDTRTHEDFAYQPTKGVVRWSSRLAETRLACLDGDWDRVALLLHRANSDSNQAVQVGTARTICRLATAHRAISQEWEVDFDLGLQLVAQIAPFIPEFPEVIWRCAESKAKTSSEPALVAPRLVASIASGQNAMLKHSVFAISNAIGGKPEVGKSHMQLLHRSGGSMAIVARTALWYLQVADEDSSSVIFQGLQPLLKTATEIEPKSGLNWFALGFALVRQERFADAITPLETAQSLLGKMPAIEELLKTARASRK